MATLEIGRDAQLARRFAPDDVDGYRALGGHVPPGGEVPEPLIDALFSQLLGMSLPGLGTNYLKQHSAFRCAARVGERLTARVEVSRLRPEKHLVDLITTCRGEDGRLVCEGRALVYIRDVATGG